MKMNIKWLATLCLTAVMTGFYSCDNDDDGSYSGSLDLNLLSLTQARDVWTGSECNVSTALMKNEVKAKNFSYKLNVSLYQNRKAAQDAVVDIVIDKDSLNKAIAKANGGGVYAKYAGVEILPEDLYFLSSNKMTLHAGSVKSEDISVLVYAENLISLVQQKEKDMTFVLPLKITESSSYGINGKVNALMLFFNVTYVKPIVHEGPEFEPDNSEVPTTLDGLKLAFSEEFRKNGEPDWDVWRWEDGFQRNQELQWYQKGNVIVKDDLLVIEGKEERVKNPNYEAGSSDWKKNREYAEYTSSCLITKEYRFRKGRLLVRAKIPTAMGAWPAIWTTGGSNDSWCWEWPLGGEIDLLEYYLVGGKPSLHANACWGSNTRWSGKWKSYNRPLSEFVAKDKLWEEKYHIWRMDWDDDYIRLYLDDELLNEIDLKNTTNGTGGLDDWWRGSYRNPFTDAGNSGEKFGQCIWLNLALGSNGGTPDLSSFPLKYYVDYVRVYQ